jgi:hypothetical protein
MSDVIDRLRSVNRAVWGSILAVAALLVSVILMILPLSTTSATYQWNPSNSSDSGAFPLDRSWPQSMVVDATFRCDDVDRVVLSTGGFQLSCQKNAIVAKSGKTILGPVNGTDGDSIRFAFTGETGDAVLSNLTTDESSSKQLKFSNFPIVHKLASLTRNRSSVRFSTCRVGRRRATHVASQVLAPQRQCSRRTGHRRVGCSDVL